MTAADELELIRPSVYRNVARQLNIPLQSETVVTDAFLAVAAQIVSAGRPVCPGGPHCWHGPGSVGQGRAAALGGLSGEPPWVQGQWASCAVLGLQ